MKLKEIFKKYWPLLIFPIGVIIDAVTKQAALKLDEPIVIIKNFFCFELVFNKGAAWGVLLPKWLLVSISLIASVGFLYYFFKCRGSMWMKVSTILVATGSFGNLIDRAFFKNGVIDFLSFTFGSYHFPVFNVADSFVVVGVILFLITTIVEDTDKKKVKENGISNN